MANGVESNLLVYLHAIQAQKVAFAGEAQRIAERCRLQHSGDRADTANRPDSSAASGEDVEMTDADAHSVSGPTGDDASKPSAEGSFLCRTCYNDLIALVHRTYAAPAQIQCHGDRQEAFLTELDRLLDDVRGLRAPLQRVDELVTKQKREWLHNQLQAAAALQALGNTFEAKAEYKLSLEDPNTDFSELLRAVVDMTGKNLGGDRDRITKDVKMDVEKLRQSFGNGEYGTIYRNNLFPGGVPDLSAARDIEKRMLSGEVGLDQGLGEVVRDIVGDDDEDSRTAKIEKHRKRLAELRRAKAAHEAQKLKKMKQIEVPYFLQDDTPCSTCGKPSDPQKSPFCNVCFMEVDYCLRENQTVWCSTACVKKSYASHFAVNHPCAAADHCARSKPESDIARQEPRYFFCRECVLSFSISTVYCNDRCAGRDFQRHREKVHLPNREMRADTHDDRSDLSYSSFAKIDYTAADIAKHLMSIDEAFSSLQKKHPDWTLTEKKVQLMLPWAL